MSEILTITEINKIAQSTPPTERIEALVRADEKTLIKLISPVVKIESSKPTQTIDLTYKPSNIEKPKSKNWIQKLISFFTNK